jgi:hypothetical protein
MSLASTDIVIYGSANMPEDGVSTVGGAIDTATRIIPDSASLFNSLSDKVDIVSSNSGDTTQTVTITGLLASGVRTSETLSLNGTTTVNGTNTYARLEKVVASGSHTGTITFKKHTGGSTITSMESGVLTIRRPFYGDFADASGGSSHTYYEKCFAKNTNGTSALLPVGGQSAAQVSITDGTGLIQFGLAGSVNDSLTTTNRTTAPSGISFGTSAVNIPGTNLNAGDAIGIWMSLTLSAGTAAAVNTFTLTTSGTTA